LSVAIALATSSASAQRFTGGERVALLGDEIAGETLNYIHGVQVNSRGDVAFQMNSERSGSVVLDLANGGRGVVVDPEFAVNEFRWVLLGEYNPTGVQLPALTDAGEVLFFGVQNETFGGGRGVFAANLDGERPLVWLGEPVGWFPGLILTPLTARAIPATSGRGIGLSGSFDLSEGVPYEGGLLYGFLLEERKGEFLTIRPHSFHVPTPGASVGPSSMIGLNGEGQMLVAGQYFETEPEVVDRGLSLSVLDGEGAVHTVVVNGDSNRIDGGELRLGGDLSTIGRDLATLAEDGSVLFEVFAETADGRDIGDLLYLWRAESGYDLVAPHGTPAGFTHNGSSVINSAEAEFDRDSRVLVGGTVGTPCSDCWIQFPQFVNGLWDGPVEDGRLIVRGGRDVSGGIEGGWIGGPQTWGSAEDLRVIVFRSDFEYPAEPHPESSGGLWVVDDRADGVSEPRLLWRADQGFEVAPGDVREVVGFELLGVSRDGVITLRVRFADVFEFVTNLEGIYRLRLRAGPSDLNGDGLYDRGDIGAFIAAFLDGRPIADLTGDGVLDLGDLLAFVDEFLDATGG